VTKLLATSQEVAKETGRIIGHGLAVILIVLGAGMGVSLVLLPIGIPVGLIGLAIALWGAFGWALSEKPPS
jgi:hypothetical protein